MKKSQLLQMTRQSKCGVLLGDQVSFLAVSSGMRARQMEGTGLEFMFVKPLNHACH